MTVGIYYATTTGKTEDVADRLHNFISSAESPKDVSDVDDLSEFEGLDGIICGIPTWNTGADEERSGTAWDSILEDIGELSLSGKKVAIFGLGDSSTYTENYCDAMEELHSYFQKAGADMVGYVDKSAYTFEESKSIIGESFCGLPLDEDSESDLTDSRLETWATQLKGEISALA
tara:strand:+ start:24 stop:548 length:525 start_codon:yes stop_codon:yes gene_type:complete